MTVLPRFLKILLTLALLLLLAVIAVQTGFAPGPRWVTG
jgi:hypothetical protein